MSDDEKETLQKRAADLVEQLAGASGSAEMDLMDNVTHVGTQVQRNSAGELDLLRVHGVRGVEFGVGGDWLSVHDWWVHPNDRR